MKQRGERQAASGSETRRRQCRVTFRLTAAELAELEGAAERAGLTLGSYIRASVLAAPVTRSRRRPTIERELMAQAVAWLGRASGSLHQVARRLNFGEVEHAAELPATLSDIRAAVAQVMRAAGREPRETERAA